MRVVYILLAVLFFCSCKKKENDTKGDLSNTVKEIKEKRVLYSFKSIDLRKIEDYILTVRKNDKFIIYSYVNVNDDRKNMRFSFNRKSKKLHWGPETFTMKNDEFLMKNIKKTFSFYWKGESGCHQTQPVLFNKEYGVLGIYNSYGPDFVFLNEEIEKKDLLENVLISMENFNPN